MKNLRVHFMGIGGSGVSGVALIARSYGFKVSGCDLQSDTPYLKKLKEAGVKISEGHDVSHVSEADILAVSPSIFFLSSHHPEILEAKRKKKLMAWQEFLGKYLHSGKKVVCIAGTHGKSTTTALAGLLFENAKKDPLVVIGANVKRWGGNARVGKGEDFITESDEFYDNFLNYKPEVIILTNIEFDHPDYFKNENQLFDSFIKHIRSLQGSKILIFNQDSPGIKKLFAKLGKKFLTSINLVGYTVSGNPPIKAKKSFCARDVKLNKNFTAFSVKSVNLDSRFTLKILGMHNISNSLAVIALGNLYHVPTSVIRKTLANYAGIERRLELISGLGKVRIFDDYAHHPTAIRATLGALRQRYPKERIWCIIEPHTFSRTKALLHLYKNAFEEASDVIIAPIYKSRDTHDFGMSGESIVKVAKHEKISYINSFEGIKKLLVSKAKDGDVIVVMGAGESYKLARELNKDING